MAKIGYLYLRNGMWEGKELISSAWIDKVNHATIDMHLARRRLRPARASGSLIALGVEQRGSAASLMAGPRI